MSKTTTVKCDRCGIVQGSDDDAFDITYGDGPPRRQQRSDGFGWEVALLGQGRWLDFCPPCFSVVRDAVTEVLDAE